MVSYQISNKLTIGKNQRGPQNLDVKKMDNLPYESIFANMIFSKLYHQIIFIILEIWFLRGTIMATDLNLIKKKLCSNYC